MMALPASGPLSIGNIRSELLNTGTNNFRLSYAGMQSGATIGSGYVPLNNSSSLIPFSGSPFSISEWYNYDHSSNRSCGVTFFSAATQIDKYYYQRFLIIGCGASCKAPIRIFYSNPPPNNLSPRTDYLELYNAYPFNNVGAITGTPGYSLALGFGSSTGPYDIEWTVSSTSEPLYVVSWADDPFDVYNSGPYDLRIGCGTPTNTPTLTKTPTPTQTRTPTQTQTPTTPGVQIQLSTPQLTACVACYLTTYSTIAFRAPADSTPTVNDIVYTTSSLATGFNGASQWWKTSWGGDLYSIQINASGLILAVTTCSTCPTQTPTPSTTPAVTPTPSKTPAVTPSNTVTPSQTQTPTSTPSPLEYLVDRRRICSTGVEEVVATYISFSTSFTPTVGSWYRPSSGTCGFAYRVSNATGTRSGFGSVTCDAVTYSTGLLACGCDPTPTPTATNTATPAVTPSKTPTTTPTQTQAPVGYGYWNTANYNNATDACRLGSLPNDTLYASPGNTTPFVGMVLYTTQSPLSNPFNGQNRYWRLQRSSTVWAVQINTVGQVTAFTDCSTIPSDTPTPSVTSTPASTPPQTPTNTQTPTKTQSSLAYSFTALQSDECTACRSTTYIQTKYVSPGNTSPDLFELVYNDSNLSSLFVGNNGWYGTLWGTTTSTSYSVQINNSGQVIAIKNCSTCPSLTPTPTLTSTPPVTPTQTPTPSNTGVVLYSVGIYARHGNSVSPNAIDVYWSTNDITYTFAATLGVTTTCTLLFADINVSPGTTVYFRVQDANLNSDIYFNATDGVNQTDSCPTNAQTYCTYSFVVNSSNHYINITAYNVTMFGDFVYCS